LIDPFDLKTDGLRAGLFYEVDHLTSSPKRQLIEILEQPVVERRRALMLFRVDAAFY
jgi:hypothetical protein